MIRTNLLKRLESSVYAFSKTVDSLIDGINFIIQQMLYDEEQFENPDFSEEWEDEEFFASGLTIGIITKMRVADLGIVK